MYEDNASDLAKLGLQYGLMSTNEKTWEFSIHHNENVEKIEKIMFGLRCKIYNCMQIICVL